MTVTEEIIDRLKLLPPKLQREVLDLIEFLRQNAAQGEDASEQPGWTKFSLAQAMNGLENEDSLEYSEADLKGNGQ